MYILLISKFVNYCKSTFDRSNMELKEIRHLHLIDSLSNKNSHALHLHSYLQRISKIIDKKSYSHLSREREVRRRLGRSRGEEQGCRRGGLKRGRWGAGCERPGSLAAWPWRDFRGEFSTRGSGCVRSSLSLAPFFCDTQNTKLCPFS